MSVGLSGSGLRVLTRCSLVAAALLLAACAATPRVQQEAAPAELSRYKNVQVIVEAPEAVRQQTGYAPTAAALSEEFIENVKASGKYKTVGPTVAGADVLEARLTITELNYVHGAARGFAGVLGGRAILNVTMTLRNKSTEVVLGAVSASHVSSHAQGVFSPTTSRQVTAIAKEFASKL